MLWTQIDVCQKPIDGGVTQIYIHSPQPIQERVVRFYTEQVLPRLRR